MTAPYFSDGQVTLLQGHVLDRLREIPSDSVQCVITSPPYWALRSYATEPQVWGGNGSHDAPGVYECETCQITRHINRLTEGCPQCGQTMTPVDSHTWGDHTRRVNNRHALAMLEGLDSKDGVGGLGKEKNNGNPSDWNLTTHYCPCGAWRGELGHEPTPQMFVQHLVEVFREVRRVLKPDGVCFVNLGDSYAGSGRGPQGESGIGQHSKRQGFIGGTDTDPRGQRKNKTDAPEGLLAKSLCLIPERFALAMQDDGWYCRSRIAWCKRAPMPESVRDRPTNAWEHIWMFTRSAKYYWDADAVREANTAGAIERFGMNPKISVNNKYEGMAGESVAAMRAPEWRGDGRNMWSYWLLSPDPEPMAHFATFPREVPRRCIAAATSDKGECPKCGKPWVRTTDRQYVKSPVHGAGSQTRKRSENGADVNGWAGMPRVKLESTTTGWAPQCAHDLPPIPQTVLDPFVGSGTTTMVARSMLRRSIGIDLSEEYLHNIALKKNAQMALMAPDTEVS